MGSKRVSTHSLTNNSRADERKGRKTRSEKSPETTVHRPTHLFRKPTDLYLTRKQPNPTIRVQSCPGLLFPARRRKKVGAATTTARGHNNGLPKITTATVATTVPRFFRSFRSKGTSHTLWFRLSTGISSRRHRTNSKNKHGSRGGRDAIALSSAAAVSAFWRNALLVLLFEIISTWAQVAVFVRASRPHHSSSGHSASLWCWY